ncbi:hypothetical protein B0H67DRAFT_558412 [Lasiosphaeris hirsuta]|uniref:HNH nuclease domain-containing protein n=1 Tax=Lasiosphaeris hirsuta TaxID=260670 RepID=A0AA40DH03_9PEZI|nr:hypothetical protein B0H67DRAFT_558412 [Lasiosphaeris hirsuta]
MRQMGWNVHVLDLSGQRFGSVYHRGDLTIEDVWREQRMCFDFSPPPNDNGEQGRQSSTRAFPTGVVPDQLRPSPVSSSRRKLSGLITFILRVATPTRRFDARYLPPNKVSNDPHITLYPTRRKAKAVSPSKRSASGSSVHSRSLSPNREEDDDALGNVIIPESAIPIDEARQEITEFRQRCMTSVIPCAISGLGKSWFSSPAIGPEIQAAHVVPKSTTISTLWAQAMQYQIPKMSPS